ncbi:hypothetical protein LEP1GSC170_1883 [Leptospira interrogans serovar Bataviae str. HAI135]|nr:hypothetical protein LEP1GSC170_1883 [Leptospira interrogans serovar Bataviae str. HAI135]
MYVWPLEHLIQVRPVDGKKIVSPWITGGEAAVEDKINNKGTKESFFHQKKPNP